MKKKDQKSKYVQPSRAGRKAVKTYLSPEAYRRLSLLGELNEISRERLVAKAIKRLFKHHRLSQIAE